MKKPLSHIAALLIFVNSLAFGQNAFRNPPSCFDSSGSGTTQVCNTSQPFTPKAGDCIIYTTTTTNTGSLTLNVNSLGAKNVEKWLNNTSLVAGDIPANRPILVCYDGTNWNPEVIGNTPTAGIVSSNGINIVLTGTSYAPLNGVYNSIVTAIGNAESPVAAAPATFSNLSVVLGTPLSSGQTLAITLLDNGTSTALTCTVNGSSAPPANAQCSDTTHSYTLPASDLAAWQLMTSGGSSYSNVGIGARIQF